MTGENVDRTAFAGDRERDLDGDIPTVRGEELDDLLDQAGMGRVEQSIERLAVPAKSDIEPGLEGGGDPNEGRDRDVARSTAFKVRDYGARGRREHGEIDLAPAAPNPECAKRETEADPIHDGRMTVGAALRLIAAFTIAQR